MRRTASFLCPKVNTALGSSSTPTPTPPAAKPPAPSKPSSLLPAVSSAPAIEEFTPPEPTPQDPYPGYYLLPSGAWAAYDTAYYQRFYTKWKKEYDAHVRALEKGVEKGFEAVETEGAQEVDAAKEMERAKREIQDREEKKALTKGGQGEQAAPKMNIKVGVRCLPHSVFWLTLRFVGRRSQRQSEGTPPTYDSPERGLCQPGSFGREDCARSSESEGSWEQVRYVVLSDAHAPVTHPLCRILGSIESSFLTTPAISLSLSHTDVVYFYIVCFRIHQIKSHYMVINRCTRWSPSTNGLGHTVQVTC